MGPKNISLKFCKNLSKDPISRITSLNFLKIFVQYSQKKKINFTQTFKRLTKINLKIKSHLKKITPYHKCRYLSSVIVNLMLNYSV